MTMTAMTFDALSRVAVSMPLDEIVALVEAQTGREGFGELARQAGEFSYSADPVSQFKEMMIADVILRKQAETIGHHAADLADAADAADRRQGVKRAGRTKTAPPVVAPVEKKTNKKTVKPGADKKPSVKSKNVKEQPAKATVVKTVEHVQSLKKAKPYPQGSVIVQSGKREIPIKARVAVVLSVLQGAGVDSPCGKKDLMRVIGKHFANAPGVNSKEGISSGANGNYNDSVEYLQSLGLCRRMSATEAGIEGGAGKVAMLTKEGAAILIPDACKIG